MEPLVLQNKLIAASDISAVALGCAVSHHSPEELQKIKAGDGLDSYHSLLTWLQAGPNPSVLCGELKHT